MTEILEHAFFESFEITGLVFIALVVMDLAYVYSRGKLVSYLEKHPRMQYVISAFLGAIPGCEGVFLTVSLHTHGLISFGALLAAFIATSGDEAYVMFSRFPGQALKLTLILFVTGYLIGWLVDSIQKRSKGDHARHCQTKIFHPNTKFSLHHYLTEHLWEHIFKKHIIKIFIWTFVAIFLIEAAIHFYDVKHLISDTPFLMLLVAGLIGLIPQSGPHLIFVTMFAEGTIPFSILFTNMFVQNGHALLPLLSVSIKDSVWIKIIGLVAGLLLGSLLLLLHM
jgi:hypothetical protein